ncbi:hypothetical protein ACHWQZ_G018427 [Mnemiopsis leidyi]
MIEGVGLLPYSERLQILQLTTLAERRSRGDLIEVYKASQGLTVFSMDDDDDALFEDDIEDVMLASVTEGIKEQPPLFPKDFEELAGFDMNEGKHWIYPVNYPLRSYQFNIVQKALFWNTLVTLPTGLGKTFVAAVVIHNFYRWYPEGKILFMAPTKPLVAQQIRACHDIVGIPQQDLGELTGNLNPARRDKIWRSKRVFFLTPQIVQNDLGRGMCPAAEVVLVVIDEAHKATGNHAYCQVIKELQNYKSNFRVLALSATPGDNLVTVQSVLTNLLISHVEIRSEESLDIQPYTHNRKMDKIILPLDQPLNHVKQTFLTKVLDKYVQTLITHRALYCTDISCLTKFTLLQQRQTWRNRNSNLPGQVASMLEGVYFVLMNLYHAFELLLIHGAGVFIHYCLELLEGKKGNASTKSKLLRDQDFLSLVDKLQRWRNNGKAYELNNVPFVDHPKLSKLLEILTKHFTNCDDQTRAMVFSSYRDSVHDLVKRINSHNNQLRSTPFIGQSGAQGLKQKKQLETVVEFKKGTFNVLVATCVGEEGLDIGMVDLIVCYDASASPTRLVQRMGRAARKRDGSIVVLLTEGKEENIFKKSMTSKKSVSKAVITKLNKLSLYPHNPRMIPRHLNPTPDKRVLKPVEFKTPPPKLRQKSAAQKQKCPFLSSTQYSSYVGNGAGDVDLDRSARFSLSECLANWIHWQGTEHPTFDIEHSMSTLTFVHVMTVNDFFKSDSAAIENYEEEMSQNLDLDDVVVTKKKMPSAPLDPTLSDKKKAKPRQIVISDDEFETKSSFKQSKLNFETKPGKPKVSLFSCLADVKEKTDTGQTNKLVEQNEEKPDTTKTQGSEEPPIIENVVMPDVCDVQHDVSLESLVSPAETQSAEKPAVAGEGGDEIPLSRPQVEDLKDLNENELSDSLFEAINETWDFELSQKAPELVEIPVPPSQVPCLENSDFSLFSSQQTDKVHVKSSAVPLCPKSSISAASPEFSDIKESDNTLTLKDISNPTEKQETLFQSLAKMEKDQLDTEDLDFSDDITFSDIISQPNDNIVQTSHMLTPAQHRPFKPIESSTPAVIKLPVQKGQQELEESKEFVTPHVRPCLRRVKKKPNKIEKTHKAQVETTSCNSSAEDSPLNVGKRKRRCNILCSQAPSIIAHEDLESSNSNKKSRLLSPGDTSACESAVAKALPAKRSTVKTEGGAAACPYVLSEADLSGDEDVDETADEDFMSSSLEDFIDEEENAGGSRSVYLRDIARLDRQKVRTVGNNFTGNVYSQDPRLDEQEPEEEGEFDSFICDDEEFSLLEDDFEQTAVFTQQLQDQTLTPTVKKKRKRRVKEFVESPVTAQFSVSKTETDTNILSDQIPDAGFRSPCVKGKTSSKVTTTPKRSLILEKAGRKEKGEEKIKQTDGKREEWKAATSQISTSSVDVSSFLLGLDELLPDVEDKKESCQDDDDDFEIPASANRSRTTKNKEKSAKKTKLLNKLTSRSHDNKENKEDSTLDLFGDSLDESMIAAACRTINQTAAPVPDLPRHTSNKSSSGSFDDKISSQFNIDLEDLLSEESAVNNVHTGVTKTSSSSAECRGRDGKATTKSAGSGRDRPRSSQFDINLDELLESDTPHQVTVQQKSSAKLGKKNDLKDRQNPALSVPQPEKIATEDFLVFARTKVISNNQICSILRTRHRVRVEIRVDLGNCDYVVNSNTAILRINLLDVYKGVSDLLARVQTLQRTFKHIVLICELPPPGKKKGVSRSESYDPVRFAVTEQKLRLYNTSLLLSESQDKTAEIISRFIGTEDSQQIPDKVLSEKQIGLEKLLVTIPCINHGNARLLVLKYPSLSALLSSKPDDISVHV